MENQRSYCNDESRGSNHVSDREHALAQLRRLTDIILDDLAEGSRNKLLDPKETRLITGTAMRTIRLYVRTLEGPVSKGTYSSSEKLQDQTVVQEDQNRAAGK